MSWNATFLKAFFLIAAITISAGMMAVLYNNSAQKRRERTVAADLLLIIRTVGGRACTAEGYSLEAEMNDALRKTYLNDFSNPAEIEYLFIPSQKNSLVWDAVRCFPRLRVLSLAECTFESHLLLDSTFHENLVFFDANRCRIIRSGDAASEFAVDSSRLQKVILSYCDGVDDEIVGSFVHSSALEFLDLSYSSITNRCVPALQQFKRLRVLSIAGCSLNDDDVSELLQDLPQLEQLYLRDTPTSSGLLAALSRTKLVLIQLSKEQSRSFALDPAKLCGESWREVWCEDDLAFNWQALAAKCPDLTIRRYAVSKEE